MGPKVLYKVASRFDIPNDCKRNFVREHILIEEKKLGRQLKKGEVVHHCDKNKLNNDPNNLIVFASNADHSAFHKGAEIVECDGVWKAKVQQFELPYRSQEYKALIHGGVVQR